MSRTLPCNCNHGFSRSRYPQQVRSHVSRAGSGLGRTLTSDCGGTAIPRQRSAPHHLDHVASVDVGRRRATAPTIASRRAHRVDVEHVDRAKHGSGTRSSSVTRIGSSRPTTMVPHRHDSRQQAAGRPYHRHHHDSRGWRASRRGQATDSERHRVITTSSAPASRRRQAARRQRRARTGMSQFEIFGR